MTQQYKFDHYPHYSVVFEVSTGAGKVTTEWHDDGSLDAPLAYCFLKQPDGKWSDGRPRYRTFLKPIVMSLNLARLYWNVLKDYGDMVPVQVAEDERMFCIVQAEETYVQRRIGTNVYIDPDPAKYTIERPISPGQSMARRHHEKLLFLVASTKYMAELVASEKWISMDFCQELREKYGR